MVSSESLIPSLPQDNTITPLANLLPIFALLVRKRSFSQCTLGNFSDSLSENATWTSLVRYGNSSENETWTQPFCMMLEGIDQPDPDRETDCPPEAGWALINMEGWVWRMFIVPVSLRLNHFWGLLRGKDR